MEILIFIIFFNFTPLYGSVIAVCIIIVILIIAILVSYYIVSLCASQ